VFIGAPSIAPVFALNVPFLAARKVSATQTTRRREGSLAFFGGIDVAGSSTPLPHLQSRLAYQSPSHKPNRATLVLSLKSAAMGLVLIAAVFGLFVWNFNRPPFDLGKLQRLQTGMTQQQVRQILGNPTNRDVSTWYYSGPMAWPTVKIYFDANGRFAHHEYDY
jgi:hypothetical protein